MRSRSVLIVTEVSLRNDGNEEMGRMKGTFRQEGSFTQNTSNLRLDIFPQCLYRLFWIQNILDKLFCVFELNKLHHRSLVYS